MLDEKAPAKKRKNIKTTAVKFTAVAAACAVICGVGVYAFNGQNKDSFKENILTYCDTDTTKSTDVKKVAPTASENENKKQIPLTLQRTTTTFTVS